MSPVIHILNERKRLKKKTIQIDEVLFLLSEYAKNYDKMNSILNKIYVNRNIALNDRGIREALEECDVLMRDSNRN
jgi:ABC-type phosphate transport system auxiliary subunit